MGRVYSKMEASVVNIASWIKNRKWSDWLFWGIIIFAIVTRLPTFIEQFKQQGTRISPIIVEGKLFPNPGSKSVLVFWASWCGPCTIELNRIKSAIEKKEINSKNIFAINLGESQEVITKVIKERKLNIPVINDEKGSIANLFNVKVTPTIVFIDEKGRIDWISAGLSPSLIYRIKYFLKD